MRRDAVGGRRAGTIVVVLAAGLLGACGAGAEAGPQAGAPSLLVAAASDLRPAFDELGRTYERATGQEIAFVYGSSGQLAQQVIEGAPYDLYASADVAYVDMVLAAGVGDPTTQHSYAIGRIVMWARADAWHGWSTLTDLGDDTAVRTIAIANPEHAPYGRAAREALRSAGLWEELEPHVVLGENIADAHRLAASGNADVAITALPLALAADKAGTGRWRLVPTELHAPLEQALVIIADNPARAAGAAAFVDHLSSEAGREVMRRHGFLLPGERPPSAWEGS